MSNCKLNLLFLHQANERHDTVGLLAHSDRNHLATKRSNLDTLLCQARGSHTFKNNIGGSAGKAAKLLQQTRCTFERPGLITAKMIRLGRMIWLVNPREF